MALGGIDQLVHGTTVATNAVLKDCIGFLKGIGYDLVIVETAGIGQSDSEIVDMVDFSIYNRDDDSLADIDYMGHGRDGGYAEYMALPAENAHVVSTDLTDVELATFCCAYLTGERMLERARRLAAIRTEEHIVQVSDRVADHLAVRGHAVTVVVPARTRWRPRTSAVCRPGSSTARLP